MFAIRNLLILASFMALSVITADNSKVGVVLILKGEVTVIKIDGSESYLKKGDPVFEKSILETADKSFVRIIFDDRSSVNIGPQSKMEIKHYPKNKPGVLTLLKGKVRTFVKKDYLKWRREKNKSKLFIKTETAAMGVRGTDFIVNFDRKTKVTNLDVITGQVAMVNSQGMGPKKLSSSYLDTILKSKNAVLVNPGMRSTVLNGKKSPMRPSRIPQKTFKNLQRNPNLIIKRNAPKERSQKNGPKMGPKHSEHKGPLPKVDNKESQFKGNKPPSPSKERMPLPNIDHLIKPKAAGPQDRNTNQFMNRPSPHQDSKRLQQHQPTRTPNTFQRPPTQSPKPLQHSTPSGQPIDYKAPLIKR